MTAAFMADVRSYLATPEFREACEQYGTLLNVVPNVHRNDWTMNYTAGDPDFASDRTRAVKYYFEDGADSARKLLRICDETGLRLNGSSSILEFASGFGRVTRHWKNLTPAKVFASDIHKEANSFIRERIGTPTIASRTRPELFFTWSRKFDVIFCLSFFTHMPEKTWHRWLKRLYGCLKPGGLLVITTHGDTPIKIRKIDYTPGTLHYTPESEQLDLSVKDYGYTACDETFVRNAVARLPSAEIVWSRKDYYWALQDCFAIRRG